VKDALSDGTLDQLYLSLRFASLEQHLEAQEPMPLVLDDIFIHFDDDRTVAGLRVLAEFAQKTQVLLLTHHARNLDLARRALDAGSWREHRLDPPATAHKTIASHIDRSRSTFNTLACRVPPSGSACV
jgi:wobble nucleotide-excising tRNase